MATPYESALSLFTPSPEALAARRRAGNSRSRIAQAYQEGWQEQTRLNKDAAQAAEDQAREAERQQRETAKAAEAAATQARKEQQAAQEEAFRRSGRPFFTDALGNLKPTQDDATWEKMQADKAAKTAAAEKQKAEREAAKEEAIRLRLARQDLETRSRQIDLETTQADLSATEAGVAVTRLAAQIKTLEAKRDAASPEDYTKIEPAIGALQKQLEELQKRKNEAEDAKRRAQAKKLAWQQETLAPQAELDRASLSLSRGTPAPGQAAAPASAPRVSHPPSLPATAGQAIVAPVEAPPPADPAMRATYLEERARAAAADTRLDTASALARSQALRRRAKDPEGWLAEQTALADSLALPDLQAHAETVAAEISRQVPALNERATALQQQWTAVQAGLKTLEQRNAARMQKPIADKDTVTLTRPDGVQMRWERSLGEQYLAQVEKAREWQTTHQPELDRVELERQELALDQRLLAAQQDRLTQKAKGARQEQLSSLSSQGFATQAAQLAELDADTEKRRAAILQNLPAGSPGQAAALRALEESARAHAAAIPLPTSEQMEAGRKLHESLNVGQPTPWLSTNDEAAVTAMRSQGAALGLEENQARFWLDYFQKADWSKPLKFDPKNGRPLPEDFRTLPNGDVTVSPTLWGDQEKYAKAVKDSQADEAAQKRALEKFPELQKQYAASVLPTLAAAPAIPGMETFMKWRESKIESDRARFAPLSVEAQVIEYLDEMKKRPWWGKVYDQINRNLLAGFQDVATAGLGIGAMMTGSEGLSKLAATNSANTASIVAPMEMEGTNANWALKVAGQTARMAPMAAQAIATGGLGGMTAASLTGGAQTAGTLFADSYGQLRRQKMPHAEAYQRAALSSAAAGAFTALLTAGMGKTGLERLLLERASPARLSFNAYLGQIAKAAGEEIPEEIVDEWLSTLVQAVATRPNEDPVKVIKEFGAELPTLAGATGILGAAGGAAQGRGGPAIAPGSPEAFAAAWAEIENFADPSLTPDDQEAARRRASVALALAQGGSLRDVEMADLEAAGWTRDAQDRFAPLPGYAGPQVFDVVGDQAVIKDSYAKSLSTALPSVRSQIQDSETAVRNRLAAAGTSTAAASSSGSGSASPGLGTGPRPAAAASPVAPAPAVSPAGGGQASVSPSSASAAPGAVPSGPAATGQTRGTSGQGPAATAQGVAGSTSGVAAAPPAAAIPPTPEAARVQEISTHLQSAGMLAAEADAIALAAVQRHGIEGKTYAEQVTGPKFAAFLDSLGVTGSRRSQDAATNPLRAPADLATRLASPPDVADLRQRLAARTMSDQDAVRELARRANLTNPSALAAAAQNLLGLKPARAQIAVDLITEESAPLPAAPRSPTRAPASSAPSAAQPVTTATSTPVPASVQALRKNAAWTRAKMAALAGIKDPKRKAWAREVLAALEKSIAGRHLLYEALGAGPAARRRLQGQMLAVQEINGRVTLLVDLPAMLEQVGDSTSAAEAVAATGVEEAVHAAVLHLARRQPERYGRRALLRQWRELPRAIQEQVWQAYHAAGSSAQGSLPSLPARLTPAQEWALMNEYLRMLVQDAAFAGQVTESVGPSSSLPGFIRQFLADLADLLRSMVARLPAAQQAALREQVAEIATTLRELETQSEAQASRAATLPAIREAGAAALQSIRTGALFDVLATRDRDFTPNFLAYAWDSLPPALQSWVFRRRPRVNRRADKALLMRETLALLASDPSTARAAMHLLLNPAPQEARAAATATSFLRRLLGNLRASLAAALGRPLSPFLQELLSPMAPPARTALATLHARVLAASAQFEAAAAVDAFLPAQQPRTGTPTDTPFRPNPPAIQARKSAEAMLTTWAEMDAAEHALPGVSDEIQRRALARSLARQEMESALLAPVQMRLDARRAARVAPAAPATPPPAATAWTPNPPPGPARQSAEAMLAEWAKLEAAETALPGVSDEIQRRALARRLAADMWARALIQISATAEQRRAITTGTLTPPEMMVLQDALQVARGDFTLGTAYDRRQIGAGQEDGTAVRMLGYAKESTLQRLGILIAPNGTLFTDPGARPNSPAYVERNHIILRQAFLDDLAARLPVTRTLVAMSEAEARRYFGLPPGQASPTTAREVSEARLPEAATRAAQNLQTRLQNLEQAATEEAETGPAPVKGLPDPTGGNDLVSWMDREGWALGYYQDQTSGEWDWLRELERAAQQSKEHGATIAKSAREGDISHPRARLRWLQDQGIIDPSQTTSTIDEVEMAAQEAGFDVSQGLGNLLMDTLDARLAARSSPSTTGAPGLAREEAQALRFERDTATGPITVQPGELVQAFQESPTPPFVLLKDAQGQPHRVTVTDVAWQPMDPETLEMEDYQENSPWFRGREEGQPERLVVTLENGATYGRQTVPAEVPLKVDGTSETLLESATPATPPPAPAPVAPASPAARTATPLPTPNPPGLARQLDAEMWENRRAQQEIEDQIPDEIDLAAEADDYLDQMLGASPRLTERFAANSASFHSQNAAISEIDTLLHGQPSRPKNAKASNRTESGATDQLRAALTELRRGQRTGGSTAPDAARRRSENRRRDKALLTDWARDAGRLIDRLPPIWANFESQDNKGGQEHHVFSFKNRWVKITRGNGESFGFSPQLYADTWDLGRDNSSADAYLEKLAIQNQKFADGIVLHAILSNRQGDVAIVTSQPHYSGTFADPSTAIRPAMEAAGFVQLNVPNAYYRAEDNLAALDLHPENAILQQDPETEAPYLRVFDGSFSHPTGALRQVFEKLASSPPLAAAQRIARAAAETNTAPTPAQIEAENYKTGKLAWNGLRLSIENPRGSTRSGTNAAGKAWSITMPHHYGRILRTEGKDGDHVDFFMGPDPESAQVYVINQRKPGNGHFDEHKVMLGFPSSGTAARGYLDSYEKGWRGFGGMVAMTLPEFKAWLQSGDMTQPAENNTPPLANAPRVSAAQDRAYLEAVQKGDLQAAQQMVDVAARTAGFLHLHWHQTNPEAKAAIYREGFRLDKARARLSDEQVPDAFFFKADPNDIQVGGATTPVQIKVFLRYNNPKKFTNRADVNLWASKDPAYREVIQSLKSQDAKFTKKFDDQFNKNFELDVTDPDGAEAREALVDQILNNWKDQVNALAAQARQIITLNLQKEGHDAVQITNDQGSFGRTVSTTAVFHPSQIKSADPVTYDSSGEIIPLSQRFNPDNNSILFAARRTPLQLAQAASFNPTDRALSAALGRMADQALATDNARAVTDAVAAWYGSERPDAAVVRGVKEFVQREIIPETLLPREVMSLLHEMNLRTAIGQQKALDVSRALQGKPKFSDLAYPPGFAENPAHRELLFDAMEGRVPWTSLSPELQALGTRLRGLLVEAGRAAVAAGRMSPDTFEGLRTTFMPRYTREEAEAQTGDLYQKFKLGVQEIRAQRSTAFHVVDTSRKDKLGLPLIVSHNKGAWRFPNAQARDAFFEELIDSHTLADDLNSTPGLEWMTREDKRALRAVTPAMLKAPATMSPEQRAVVERVQRSLRQRFRKEDPFVPKDLVRDPVYAITRYLAQMAHDNALAEFFNAVAASPEWTSDTETRGFTPIPDHPRFGALAGKHVLKEIASQVLELADSTGQAMRLYDSLLRLWKTGKTVLNPATHARNIIGNIPFSQLAGSNILNPVNVPFYVKALRTLRSGGAEYQDLYESGVLGADYASTELKAALHDIVPPLDSGAASPESVLAGLQAMAARAAQSLKLRGWRSAAVSAAAGAGVGALAAGPAGAVAGALVGAAASPIYRGLMWAYRMEDDVFKAAAYFKARAMGMDRAAAAAHVRKWFPYYDKPTSSTLKGAQRTILPFLSFYRESARIGLLALKERPLSLAATLAIPSLITAISSALLDLSPEDEREVKKDMRGKGAKLLGFTPLAGMPLFSMVLPWRAKDGTLQQMDLSSTHPFADFLANRVESFSGEEPFWQAWARSALSNPMLGVLYTAATGRDPFGDRLLWDSSYSPEQKRDALFGHVWKTAVPPLAPGGTSWQTLANAGRRQANKTLALRDPTQAALRAIAGVDVRSADPNIYRLADEFRASRGLPSGSPAQAFPTDAAGRARKALFEELVQPSPSPATVARHLQTLNDLGNPVRGVEDVFDLLDARRPDGVINPKTLRPAFRASLPPEARRVLETALAEFQRARAAVPSALGAARSRINATTRSQVAATLNQ